MDHIFCISGFIICRDYNSGILVLKSPLFFGHFKVLTGVRYLIGFKLQICFSVPTEYNAFISTVIMGGRKSLLASFNILNLNSKQGRHINQGVQGGGENEN